MMGGAKSTAAVSAVSAAGSRRAVAGTIAEAAAIARRAAEDGQSDLVSTPPSDERERHDSSRRDPSDEACDTPLEASAAEAPPDGDPIAMRRGRAGAGQSKDAAPGPDATPAHLILAGRAYAYGKRIVHPEGLKKSGDSVAIES